MGKKYENWNEIFCDHLCEEIQKFEECPNMEHLKKVKDLIEVVNGLQEMEMDMAIRSIAEDYGYDSRTGRFRDTCYGDGMMEFMEMFNAAKGRTTGTRRRRDSRGRYMAMGGPKPTIYNPPYPNPDDYPWEYPYMMNDGKDKRRDDKKRGRVNGSDMDDDGMYMLRQRDGMPIMTPYNMAHDTPKKLTNEQYQEWMDNLQNEDGTDGAHWTKPQVEAEAKRAGIDISEYGLEPVWACTNFLYSDFCSLAAKYNVSKPSFFINMAMAFLDDKDYEGQNGGIQKLATYYHKIANVDE